MSFTLQVEFSGLCLYVTDSTNARVGILMPDCRLGTAINRHEDGSRGIPHVGYLRFDLANLAAGFGSPGGSDPQNEGLHQFDFEDLEFVVTGTAGPIPLNKINVPEVEKIVPGAGPLAGLFGVAPSPALLMRTILVDGDLSGTQKETWAFSNTFNANQPVYQGSFAPEVIWTRPVDSVKLRLKRFDQTRTLEFELKPPDGAVNATVHVKVSNLCSTNPLEWPNLGLRQVGKDDEDFKWLYRLLKPGNQTWTQALRGHRFPIPLLPLPLPQGVQDCIGTQVQGSTT